VVDEDGRRYPLVEADEDVVVVQDPATGDRRELDRETVAVVGESALAAAAATVPEPVRRLLGAVHDERSLGLLVAVVDRGPVAVRTLLSEYDCCESDLHGLLGEFRAAGLLAECRVAGERGYEATDRAREAVAHLRDAAASTDG
jgi:hypothetical protein